MAPFALAAALLLAAAPEMPGSAQPAPPADSASAPSAAQAEAPAGQPSAGPAPSAEPTPAASPPEDAAAGQDEGDLEQEEEPSGPPPLAGPLTDAADLLSREDREAIEARLARLRTEAKVELGILTVRRTGYQGIDAFGQEAARSYEKLSSGKRAFFTAAISERRMRLDVDEALRASIPDPVAERIIDAAKPAFRKEQWREGLLLIADGVEAAAEGRLWAVRLPIQLAACYLVPVVTALCLALHGLLKRLAEKRGKRWPAAAGLVWVPVVLAAIVGGHTAFRQIAYIEDRLPGAYVVQVVMVLGGVSLWASWRHWITRRRRIAAPLVVTGLMGISLLLALLGLPSAAVFVGLPVSAVSVLACALLIAEGGGSGSGSGGGGSGSSGRWRSSSSGSRSSSSGSGFRGGGASGGW